MQTHFSILIPFLFLITFTFQADPFTGTDLQSLNRISSPVLSVEGKYVIYASKKWNKTSGKSSTNLFYTEVSTGNQTQLTPPVEGQTDSSPTFSKSFPNHIIFMRSNSEVKSTLFYMKFPPSETDEPQRLTSYPINIVDFKISSNTLVFSANVYFNCTTLKCSADQITEEQSHTWRTYDRLLMFHWDEWLVQGKGSHLHVQKLKLNEETNAIELDGDVRDINYGMEINTPPLFTDNTNYAISNDGTMIAFSAHHRTHDESWNTGWKTYFMDLNEMDTPVLITGHTNARTQYPLFSNDDTKLAYLAMMTPMLESEFLHFEIYNILSNKVDIINMSVFDKSVSSYMWKNDNELIFVTPNYGVNQLFVANIADVTKPIFTQYEVKDELISYGLPFKALKNNKILLCNKVGYNHPERVIVLEDETGKNEHDLVWLNKETFENVELPQHERFSFTGGYNETVYGWIIKPINYVSGKKYRTVLLVHGGPESSWSSGWSYSWNPQMWVQQEFAVVMINPHGSTGVSQKFQDAVRNDWGGVPYEDIMTGLQYAYDHYDFLDPDNTCAAGGSYGGYMINWIEGHSDHFKCLINHDGAFSTISKFYGTEELWFQKAEFCPREKIGCNPFDGPEIREGYEKNSPERFVKYWSTPMLVIHGGLDYRVPLTEALSVFTSLQVKNVDSKFLYFPLENHWVLKAENQIKWYDEVFDWIKSHTTQN